MRAALAVGLLAVGGVTATSASWQDQEFAMQQFRAATLPPPVLTQECEYSPGLLGIGSTVDIYWDLPAGYSLDEAQLQASTAGLGSVLAPITGFNLNAATERDGSGYVTSVRTNLLGGLLGLGTELKVAITVNRYGWTSDAASIATNAGILGLGTCQNLT